MISFFTDGTFDNELSNVISSMGDVFDENTKDKYCALFLEVEKYNWMRKRYIKYLPDSFVLSKQIAKKKLNF